MSKVAPIQQDFAGGEISPRLRGKVRSELYQSAMGYIENFEVTPQGSLEMRGGSQYIDTTGEDEAGALHTFKRGLDRDVVVLIGMNMVQLFDRDGKILDEAGGNLVNDPLFEAGLSFWITQENFGGILTPVPGVGVTSYCQGQGAFTAQTIHAQAITVEANVNHNFLTKVKFNELVDQDSERSGWLIVKVYNGSNNSAPVLFEYNEQWLTSGAMPPVDTTVDFDETVLPTGTQLYIEYEVRTAVGAPLIDRECNLTFFEIGVFNEDDGILPAEWSTPSDWNDENPLKLKRIHSCIDSSVNRMFFTVLNGTMYELSLDAENNKWTFAAFTPADPASGDGTGITWTDNQPSTCTLHQGRLWLGGSVNNRAALWGSQTFNYDEFGILASPVGDSPLEFVLTSAANIMWLKGLKLLLIGTDQGEVIGRSTGSVITSTDFDFPRESAWGSIGIPPIEVGNQVVFSSLDSAKLRSLFDGGDITNSYQSSDVSFNAEHIYTKKIIDIDYSQNPNYQLFALLGDNTLGVSTFFPLMGLNASYRMTMDDDIEAVTTVSEITGMSTWMLVRRRDGQPGTDTEFTLERKDAEDVGGHKLDGYFLSDFIPADKVITGLPDYMNSYIVSIVLIDADGRKTLHPDRQPVDGEIILEDWARGSALIGLKYLATARTLPIEFTNPAGTGQVQKRKYNEIFLRLINSAIPLVNGQRPAIRSVDTPMNLSEPLITGDTKTWQWGYDDGVIEIIQDKPLPTHITAIFGKAKGNSV